MIKSLRKSLVSMRLAHLQIVYPRGHAKSFPRSTLSQCIKKEFFSFQLLILQALIVSYFHVVSQNFRFCNRWNGNLPVEFRNGHLQAESRTAQHFLEV